jgi:uncharacterized membrane protein
MKIVVGVGSVLVGWVLASLVAVSLIMVGLNIPAALARTYREYSTYNGALILVLTILISWVIYRTVARNVFHWTPDPRPWSERVPRWMAHPSGIGLVIAWVVGVFTWVGYPVAIYMSWRFYTEWRTSQATCPRCAERITAAATMCRHCGLDLSASVRTADGVAQPVAPAP